MEQRNDNGVVMTRSIREEGESSQPLGELHMQVCRVVLDRGTLAVKSLFFILKFSSVVSF